MHWCFEVFLVLHLYNTSLRMTTRVAATCTCRSFTTLIICIIFLYVHMHLLILSSCYILQYFKCLCLQAVINIEIYFVGQHVLFL